MCRGILSVLILSSQTTAHTLCFTFALLGLYQEEQEILYQQIKSVLTDDRMPVRHQFYASVIRT